MNYRKQTVLINELELGWNDYITYQWKATANGATNGEWLGDWRMANCEWLTARRTLNSEVWIAKIVENEIGNGVANGKRRSECRTARRMTRRMANGAANDEANGERRGYVLRVWRGNLISYILRVWWERVCFREAFISNYVASEN